MLMFYKNEIIIMEIDFLWNFGCSGYNMTVDLEFSKDRSNFFRLCYALANNEEEILESKRLTDAVYEFFSNGLEF